MGPDNERESPSWVLIMKGNPHYMGPDNEGNPSLRSTDPESQCQLSRIYYEREGAVIYFWYDV